MANPLSKSFLLVSLATVGMLAGCANYEVNSTRGNIPGYYIRYEMQEADRAVEAARQAGKDKACPAEFKAAEDAKNHAYDVFRACHTEEGAALAKEATAKVAALCPAQAAEVAPAPVIPVPAPMPPTAKLTVNPDAITKGDTALLAWSSRYVTACDIEPGIGEVPVEGAMNITPAATTSYTLTCNGQQGSTAKSVAQVAVTAPAPVVAPAPQAEPAPVVAAPPPAKLCSPTVIDIQFDTNKSDIKPRYHDELKKLGDFLVQFPNAKGVIEGHTDSVGDKASNMKLSQRRAESVRNYIVKTFGIAPERLSAKGYGPTKPVADNKTKEGKAKNRRTEANFSCD